MLIGFGPPIPEDIIIYIPEFVIQRKDNIIFILGRGSQEEFRVILTEKDLASMFRDGKASEFNPSETMYHNKWPVLYQGEGRCEHMDLTEESSFRNSKSMQLLTEASNLSISKPELAMQKFKTACYLRNIKLGGILSKLQEYKTDDSQSLIDLAQMIAAASRKSHIV
jgi:hypothetical protein